MKTTSPNSMGRTLSEDPKGKYFVFKEDYSFRYPAVPQWLVTELLIRCIRRFGKPHPHVTDLFNALVMECKEVSPDRTILPNTLLFDVLEQYIVEIYEKHREHLE